MIHHLLSLVILRTQNQYNMFRLEQIQQLCLFLFYSAFLKHQRGASDVFHILGSTPSRSSWLIYSIANYSRYFMQYKFLKGASPITAWCLFSSFKLFTLIRECLSFTACNSSALLAHFKEVVSVSVCSSVKIEKRASRVCISQHSNVLQESFFSRWPVMSSVRLL